MASDVVSDQFDPADMLLTDAVSAAKRLLGSLLICTVGGADVRMKIVETEAYDETDSASHSYKGRTGRTDVMFGPAGYLYVYFTYGMHYCCNIVVSEEGSGAAVLIRAVEPLDYVELLSTRRGGKSGIELTNGPAKLCQALGITTSMNGHDLRLSPLKLRMLPPVSSDDVESTTRIGISLGKERRWRFYIKDNPYVSVRRVNKKSAVRTAGVVAKY